MEQEKSFDEWLEERLNRPIHEGLSLEKANHRGMELKFDLIDCYEWTKQNERNRIIAEIEKLESIEAFAPFKQAVLKIIRGEQ